MPTDLSLSDSLAEVLPKGFEFRLYHLSTAPTQTDAIYSSPDTKDDITYCEKHFLTVSINAAKPGAKGSTELLVFAIEVLIYSTAFSTTFFVSKADSTGYLHFLDLPEGTSSPLKTISSTFLEYLVRNRRRRGIRRVVSLFARAQDQYLFPGSIENTGKHVLDDQGLVRWWCRVLDLLIVKLNEDSRSHHGTREEVKGYLVVPGSQSALSYIPAESRTGPVTNWRWKIGHPLREISRHPDGVSPRCLIPRFPDDPKARYLADLDSELKGKSSDGQWTSVKTVEQFWESMAFRQECSAGRMVGFLWVVLTPGDLKDEFISTATDQDSKDMGSQISVGSGNLNSTCMSSFSDVPSSPATSFLPSSQILPPSPLKSVSTNNSSNPRNLFISTQPKEPTSQKQRKRKRLQGPIIARQPKVKTRNSLDVPEFPATTPFYSCPPNSRGQVVLAEKDYNRLTELLLRLDFANESVASQSSSRWINEVHFRPSGNRVDPWGTVITGKHEAEITASRSSAGAGSLSTALMRTKRKPGPRDAKDHAGPIAGTSSMPAITVLASGMVRKKPKV